MIRTYTLIEGTDIIEILAMISEVLNIENIDRLSYDTDSEYTYLVIDWTFQPLPHRIRKAIETYIEAQIHKVDKFYRYMRNDMECLDDILYDNYLKSLTALDEAENALQMACLGN